MKTRLRMSIKKYPPQMSVLAAAANKRRVKSLPNPPAIVSRQGCIVRSTLKNRQCVNLECADTSAL